VTPGTNTDIASLQVSCNLSWAGKGFTAPLDPDATGLVFSITFAVPGNAKPGGRVGTCTVNDQELSSSTDYSLTIASPETNSPPTVATTGPYAVDEGGSVSVSANGSDPEGAPLTYAWDLDGNGSFETPGQTVAFSAGDGPDARTIAVQVTDSGGLTATAATDVTIDNVPPTATLGAPSSTAAGFPIALSLTSPSDPSTADTTTGFTYSFSCDGINYGAFGSAATASCPTTDVGVRMVGAKIKDKDGGTTTYTATVHVVVTFGSLCDLVRAYSTDPKVADDLCAKLAQAEAGSPGSLGAFRNQAAAKVDKGLTAAQVAELTLLSTRV
jgi:hypothetical protein